MDIKKIISSVPINRTAALVTSKSKDNHTLKTSDGDSTRDFIEYVPSKPHPNLINFTGFVFNRLTVVGVKPNVSPVRWVCRCVCGRYCVRRTYMLKKYQTGEQITRAMCGQCDKLEYLKTGSYL